MHSCCKVKFVNGPFDVLQVHAPPDDDTQDTDDEADIMAAAASRGRRSAVVAPRPSQKRKASVDKRTPP